MRGFGRRRAVSAGTGVLALGAMLLLPGSEDPARSQTAVMAAATTPRFTIAFGGDVHFADQVARLLKNPGTSLASLRPTLGAADISVVNLETAITSRGTPAPKQYHFRTTPTALTALSAAGVDVVTMANNHSVDYGKVGLQDTLAAQRNSKLPIVGIGPNASRAYAPAILTVRGTRVAVLGASQLNDWTLQNWAATATRPGLASAVAVSKLTAAVRAARAKADVVVVYLHWGTEGRTCPDGSQQKLAKTLAAAGADIVVGSHSHRVEGAGWLGRTYVDYGLGNFIWYNSASDGSSTTGVLTLTVSGRTVTGSSWTPLRIGSDGVPRVPNAATRARMLTAWKQARGCTGLSGTAPRG